MLLQEELSYLLLAMVKSIEKNVAVYFVVAAGVAAVTAVAWCNGVMWAL